MQKLIWQNSLGDEIDLTKSPYGITNWEGFSNTSLNIQSQQVPFQDGGVFLDALMEQRELEVTLAMQDNNDLEERYRMRRELIHALNPKLGEGYLIYTNDFTSKRIKCVAQIPLFETHNSNDSGTPKASLAWTACEPYWEDLEETSVFIDIGELPTLENNGDVPTRMKIEFFTRNATNPILINMTTNKSIGFNGVLDKNLYIDTNIGQKKVYTEDYNFKPSRYYGRLYKLCYDTKLFAYFGVTVDINIRRYNIVKSYDGKKWEVVFSTEGDSFNNGFIKIIYDKDKDLIIAVDSSRVFTSQNGEDWTEKSNSVDIKDIIIADGKYVLLSNFTVFISEDLETWTEKGIIDAKAIAYNKNTGLYITISNSMELQKSFDLETWTSQTLSGDSDTLDLIGYNDSLNLFVVCSNTELYTSADGSDWDIVQTFDQPAHNKDLVMVENKILLANYEGLLYSEDGENWNRTLIDVSLFCVCFNSVSEIYYCGPMFEIRNYYGFNLEDWNYYANDYSEFNSIIYEDKQYIATTPTKLYISKNENEFNEGETFENYNKRIDYIKEKGLYIISTSYHGIFYSKDLIHWSNYVRDNSDVLSGAVYDEYLDKILVFGNGVIYESTNGIDWGYIIVQNYINDMAYSKKGNFLIAISQYENYVLKSTDGLNWERLDAPELTTYNFFSIVYCEDLDIFVAVGASVRYSKDGVNWYAASQKGSAKVMRAVTYSNELKLFIAVGDGGDIIVSSDADKWIRFNCGINANLLSVTYGKKDNKFVICGDQGTIVYMNWLNEENQIQNIQEDSDIDLALALGNNQFRLFMNDGDFTCRISYRQKYIGV